MALILTLDVGTTNLKAGVVDESGKLIVLLKVPIPVENPENGASEHNPEKLFQLLISLGSQAARNYREKIKLVVMSTYHFGLVMLDRGKEELTGMSLLSDIRAQRTFDDFQRDFDTAELYRRTGCPPFFQYLLPRLYYFKRTNPALLNKAHYLLGSKEYLMHRMTGEIVTDVSTATATQMMNLESLQWDEQILEQIGLPRERFAAIVDGTSHISPILPSVAKELGIPDTAGVLAGFYDGGALAVGISGLEPGIGIMNVGTTAMFRVPHPTPANDQSGAMRLQSYGLFKGTYLNGGALNNASLPLDWLRAKIFDIDLQDPALLEEPAGAQPLFALPYLTGERDPRLGPYACGMFFGLRNTHSRTDLARSMLEGVAYSLGFVREALLENNVKMDQIRMGGGGAAWAAWPQIFADVLNTSILVPQAKEVALIGSAVLGLAALGEYPSFMLAAREMLNSSIRVDPHPGRAARHAERFQLFRELRETVTPLFQKLGKLTTAEGRTLPS